MAMPWEYDDAPFVHPDPEVTATGTHEWTVAEYHSWALLQPYAQYSYPQANHFRVNVTGGNHSEVMTESMAADELAHRQQRHANWEEQTGETAELPAAVVERVLPDTYAELLAQQ